jgi:hypothetical protein
MTRHPEPREAMTDRNDASQGDWASGLDAACDLCDWRGPWRIPAATGLCPACNRGMDCGNIIFPLAALNPHPEKP